MLNTESWYMYAPYQELYLFCCNLLRIPYQKMLEVTFVDVDAPRLVPDSGASTIILRSL